MCNSSRGHIFSHPTSLMAQMVKNKPAVQGTQDTWVLSLNQEDPLEKEMAIHSSILAWKVGHDRITNTFTFLGTYLGMELNGHRVGIFLVL